MHRSLRAELLKLVTTRATYGLLLGAVAVVAVSVGSTIASAKGPSLSGPVHEQVFFLLASINVGLFSLILGIRVVTDEYRNSTIVHSFLTDPGRGRTLVAKALAAALAASMVAVASLIALIAVALPLASAKGGTLTIEGSDALASAGFLLSNALWAIIGVGVGAAIRHQVAAIVGGLVWVLLIENLGSGFLGDMGAYLPGQAAYALGHALDSTTALQASTAGIVMAIYALIASLLGVAVTRARDVA
jgi:ABC-2 type transport system permease protein